jgi:cell division protein ZapB
MTGHGRAVTVAGRTQRHLHIPVPRSYRAPMDSGNTLEQLQQLSARIDKLLDLVRRLADENRSLRQSQEQLSNERAQLLSKNEQARSRVEAMINRLKSLESNS